MTIAVLKGGLSKERDVSLRSGAAVALALARTGHDVVELDTADKKFIETITKLKPKAAFLALHGKYGEDGIIQSVLEWLEIPYTGSGVLASALCVDKGFTKALVAPLGIVTPDSVVFEKTKDSNLDEFISTRFKLKLPVIIKPAKEGSTIGISRVFKMEELKPAITEALKFDTRVLVESYIEGREVTIGVLEGRPMGIVEVVPKGGFYDYKSKYTKGETEYRFPAEVDAAVKSQIEEASEAIFKQLGCEGAVRMDYMISKADGRAYFLEVNTIPGMTETSLLPKSASVLGINFDQLCETILKSARLKTVMNVVNEGP